jgi:ABC-type multidrug transport system fused ATPase/permease subunit
LVLDEPTSALDPRSEALIQESLVALKQDLTLFIIAHRMSTLTICDRVMVILDGKLDAFDTLETLRDSNHYYRVASSLSTAGWESADTDGAASQVPTSWERRD